MSVTLKEILVSAMAGGGGPDQVEQAILAEFVLLRRSSLTPIDPPKENQ